MVQLKLRHSGFDQQVSSANSRPEKELKHHEPRDVSKHLVCALSVHGKLLKKAWRIKASVPIISRVSHPRKGNSSVLLL